MSGVRKSLENRSCKNAPTETHRRGLRLATLPTLASITVGLIGLAAPLYTIAQVNVTTFHNDIGRTGQNLSETILNTSNVNATQFGKLFSHVVDGQVYAQPLYLSGVTVNGATHNVVYYATEHDTVYAFDADSNSGANANPLWQASMLTAAHGAAAGATTVPSSVVGFDISPEIGITGTPVIDPNTGTLYVVSKTIEGGKPVQRLHALDVSTGAEKLNGPVLITATVTGTGNGSVNGVLTFDQTWENQRPGLLLLNGIVYIGFAAHGDNGPWHGWILGYNASNLKQTGAYCATPNGIGGGFWMSGEGLAADQIDPVNKPFGRMFVPTGNGDYTAKKPYTNSMDYGDSHLALDLTNGVPTVTDEFTTFQQAELDAEDGDIGSGGLIVLPTQSTGNVPHLAVQAGKGGWLYLLNRDNMGGYNTTADQIVQEQQYVVGNVGVWSTPAYWNGTVYYWGRYDGLKAFPLVNGLLSTTPSESVESYGYPGSTPSISSNGTSQGIVWSIDSEAYAAPGPAILQAHSATSVKTLLYSSTTNAARDAAGTAVKFTVPTVANGKVFVGAAYEVDTYGLLSGAAQTNAPVISPTSQSYTGTLTVTLTDATAGATIYYTTDGSAPTASSPVYKGPFTITGSETINAIAGATGQLLSSQTTATYINTTQASSVVFSLASGTYATAQNLTLSNSSPSAVIYYTMDGSVPSAASTRYTGPITISSSVTVSAIAIVPGVTNSQAVTRTYTITSGGNGISFGEGFAASAGLVILNGSSQLNDSRLQLTSGIAGQAGTAWYKTPVSIGSFTSDFTFQLSNPSANGITFAIQNSPQTMYALGGNSFDLGYAPITKSLAIKFDLYNSAGEGPDSTGLYLNGAAPTVPSIDLSTTGIDLHSDDLMAVHLVYDGTTLTMTITDMVTSDTYSTSWTVNIPSIVGASTAYVGFTGSTGGLTASQKILTWSFVTGSGTVATATPTFSPAGGTYSTAQTVTISDATSGATIHYTTDGTTPTVTSAVYTAPLTVSASKTIKALAVIAGSSASGPSAVAIAVYTINLATTVATPTFSPAAGTYATAQTVTISDTTAGATIYYTTNGAAPTASSNVYSAPITVSATQTIKAIAIGAGNVTSTIATAAYTITPTANGISFGQGFASSAGLIILNGSTQLSTSKLRLTSGVAGQSGTAWYKNPVNIQSFTTDFGFQLTNPSANGFTFAIQNSAQQMYALGGNAFDLGYGPIPSSVAIKFDLYNSAGEGANSTGIYLNGAAPTVPATDLSTSGIDLHSGHPMTVHMAYDGATLTMTITDTVTSVAWSTSWTINIPSTVGSSTAFVGFTGATGGLTATQDILTWSFASGSGTGTVATPTFSPAAGTYTGPQTVTISDTTAGATIYYTTNGAAPTASSNVYSGPITVSATETLKAVAISAGNASSAITTAAYTINASTQTAAPTFSLPAGTYFSQLTVTITDATAGAKIYYTLNGTAPTTSSTLYTAPVAVRNSYTLQAIAIASGHTLSNPTSAAYNLTAATPIATPAGGTYSGPQTVTLSTATPTAGIWYTLNNKTPTGNPATSTPYTGPITISASTTLKAIATETGFTSSPVITQTYTIGTLPVAATPSFSPAPGAYASAQTVTISDAAPGNTIYYTTDGTTPTTASAVFSGHVTVSTTETLKAIAVAPGFSTSAIGTAAYTISSGTDPVLNFPTGFTLSSLNLNGSNIVGTALRLTDGGPGETASAWSTIPVNVQKFTTDFNFQATSASADGFAFVIQNSPLGIYAVGGSGFDLGYGGIGSSVAVKFDLYSNSTEGSDSTGFYTNGVDPELPSIDMTGSGIDLHSGHIMHAHLVYNGTTLTLTITDTVTNGTFTTSKAINIPTTVGASTALVGFTGGTGGLTAIQDVLNWTYTVN